MSLLAGGDWRVEGGRGEGADAGGDILSAQHCQHSCPPGPVQVEGRKVGPGRSAS